MWLPITSNFDEAEVPARRVLFGYETARDEDDQMAVEAASALASVLMCQE